MRGRATLGLLRSRALLSWPRCSSSSATAAARPVVYAHEDLLNQKRAVPYFNSSFGAAKGEEDAPPSTSPLVPLDSPIPKASPPSTLSNGLPNPAIRWRFKDANRALKDDVAVYKQLSKAKLSAQVVLTAMAGYAMCPVDPTAAQAAMDALATTMLPDGVPLDPGSNSLTLSILLPTTVGTALCSASAAAFNQLIEGPYDAQMARTRGRPMPKRTISPLHAAAFGAVTGAIGVSTLYAINPLCAALGLGTIILYCPFYTIMKRHSVYNTWLGAIVGAIPPMIGWAACTDSLNPFTQPGAYALFCLLFFWQFPHFNALAHTLRSSYASSGYRMLPVLDPAKNALVAFRYSLALIPLAFTFPYLGMTTWVFPWLASIPNGAMAYAAFRFWRSREDRRAKVLFWSSLVHLPAVLTLAMICKKGLWESAAITTTDDDDT